MARTAAISLRVDPELKAALEKLAKADGRSLAQFVERILLDRIKQEGRKRAKPAP
jgi:hypothetical protein